MITFQHNSGFYLTTVTKGLLSGLLLSSITFTIPLHNYRYWFNFTYSTIFEKYDVLKFLGCRAVFLDPKDLICSAVLLYQFRVFERKFGSRKFASYALATFVWTHLLELGFIYLFHWFEITLDSMPTGPYGLIFPWFVPYYCDIPRVAASHVFGIFPITGKSLNYIIGLQIAAGSPEALLLTFCGIMSGILHRNNFLWSKNFFQIPQSVADVFDKVIGRLIESKTAIETRLPMGATLEIQRQQRMEQLEQQLAWAQFQQRPQQRNGVLAGLFGNRQIRNRGQNNANNFQPAPAAAPPSEDNINQLVEMGFNRDSVMNALRMSNNDIPLATNVLLQES